MNLRALTYVAIIGALAMTPLTAPDAVVAEAQERQRVESQPAPDSPRARRANAFIEAMEDGSQEALRQLVEEEFSPELRDYVALEEHLSRLGRMSDLFAGAADVRMGPRSEFVVAIRLLDDAGETTRTIVLSLDEEDPHHINGIRGE